MLTATKEGLVNRENNAVTIIWREVKKKYLSEDLPFAKEIKDTNHEIKDRVLKKYTKYFDIGAYTGKIKFRKERKKEALFIQLTYDDNKNIIVDEVFKMAKKQKLNINKLIEFLSKTYWDLDKRFSLFAEESKEKTEEIIRKFVPENEPIPKYAIGENHKEIFANRFVDQALLIYNDQMEEEFSDLTRRYGFSGYSFKTEGMYNQAWKRAIGISMLYKEDLELKKLSMPKVENYGLRTI